MLTEKEKEIMLHLFKDFSSSYNSRSISDKVSMTPRGALKAMKRLEANGYVVARPFGRAIEYKLNLSRAMVRKTLELFLMEEAELRHKRWVNEFRKFEEARILILFGSAIRLKDGYNDIDLLAVVDKEKYSTLMKKVEEKNKVLAKRIHLIVQTMNDLRSNLLKKDAVVLDAIRTCAVLKGLTEFVEVVANVSSA